MIHFRQETKSIDMIDISKEKISVNCPDCKRLIRVTIAQISKQESINCSCGQTIQLVDESGSNKKTVKDINKAFKDFERTLKKFGK